MMVDSRIIEFMAVVNLNRLEKSFNNEKKSTVVFFEMPVLLVLAGGFWIVH